MARRDGPVDDGAPLRRYLLGEAVAFRELCGLTPGMWAELSKQVDQLVGGEACLLCRWELPDGHPARLQGGINDLLVLTEDDRLLLYEDWFSGELGAVSRPQHR